MRHQAMRHQAMRRIKWNRRADIKSSMTRKGIPSGEPWFWNDPGIAGEAIRYALAPAAIAYGLGQRTRMAFASPVDVGVPVICVGAATIGGAGKTPFAIELARVVGERAGEIFFLTRGYGGGEKGPHLCADDDEASAIGDEAMLLASSRPTVVAKNRARGAAFAAANGADLIIMDDGHQNPTVAKDASILLVSDDAPQRGPRRFPAGRYREALVDAAARADIVVAIDEAMPDPIAVGEAYYVRARTTPLTTPLAPSIAGRRVLAFCGIARPERFFSTLARLGAETTATIAFPDHHMYSPFELNALAENAASSGAALITTEKDHVRLTKEWRSRIDVLRIRTKIEEQEPFVAHVMSLVERNRPDWRRA
ncbi:MAG: tetraacyldisaccharide 4'-kinase [Alphaproteobacteria bacterium]|nr:tetraacyldisaccharide 4'-kinase [Alphaproteobacteria bacterium]